MRRLVVLDAEGTIVATAPHPDDAEPSAPGAPVFLGFRPTADQRLVELDVPEDLSSPEGLRDLHASFRVDVSDSGPSLSRRQAD